MKAAFYTSQGNAEDVLQVGEQPEAPPKAGEVQVAIHYSGINPGEVKKRSNAFGSGMRYPLVIPHSDGAGMVRNVGANVPDQWIGKPVLVFGAQSGRALGTAAEYCCVPLAKTVALPESVDLKQAAQMGIPGITGYQALHVTDRHAEKVALIQGGLGAVGRSAVALARRSFKAVFATARTESELPALRELGIDRAFVSGDALKEQLLAEYPDRVDHIVEVAFAANYRTDIALLNEGGSIATYATNQSPFEMEFWPFVFRNLTVHFLGSDDFTLEAKQAAAQALVETLADGWAGLPIGQVYDLDEIAAAHRHVEVGKPGRALVRVRG